MNSLMLKLTFLILLLHIVKAQNQPTKTGESLRLQRRQRCIRKVVMNPYEYPEKRCSALVNCTAMLGLESKYNAYAEEVLGKKSDADRNCSAVRYGEFGEIVDVQNFFLYLKNQSLEKATEFRCCFETDTGMFEGERHVDRDYIRKMMAPSYVDDMEIWSVIEAAIETCPTYSPNCDAQELMQCVIESCETSANNTKSFS